MNKMIIRADNKPNYTIETMFEVMEDVLSAMDSNLFKDIELLQEEGLKLRYRVYDNEITKEFNTDQGGPELAADFMEYIFSMFDAAANL